MGLPTNLDIDILRSFVLGVRFGSFAEAARQVGRSQSAISLQLRKLEQQTGCELMRKSGRGLQLTESGEIILRYAQRILDLNDEAVNAVSHAKIAGRVSVGIPPDFAETWLPEILARFGQLHPGVLVEARVDRGANLFKDLASGEIDLLVYWSDAASSGPQPGRSLAEFPMVWVGSPDLKLAVGDPLPLVVMEAPCIFRSGGIAALDSERRPWRLAFTSSSLTSLWAAVSAGLGVTVRTPEGLPADVQELGAGLPGLGGAHLMIRSVINPSLPAQRFASILNDHLAAVLGSDPGHRSAA